MDSVSILHLSVLKKELANLPRSDMELTHQTRFQIIHWLERRIEKLEMGGWPP